MISPIQAVMAFAVSAVGSGINTVAGGGSLVSFPFLRVAFGMASVPANITNTSALWPGSLAGGLGYSNLLGKAGHHLKKLLFPTFIGSILGAFLLLSTSSKVFDLLVPPLILLAGSLLAFQPRIKAWATQNQQHVSPRLGFLLQFLVSLYGGYFGAGMGIMMLAAFSLYVEGDIHEHNAIKNWLGVIINATATAEFIVAPIFKHAPISSKPLLDWNIAVPMIIGAIVGGYVSARVSQRIDAGKLRVVIAAYAFVAAGYFIYKIFVPG